MKLINNIIAEGTTLKGELGIEGNLRIEGTFQGNLYVKGRVYISDSGKVLSNIHSAEAIIGGFIIGNIYAENKVKILGTGHVQGNIYAPGVACEEGAVFNGDCIVIREKNADK